jgi:hypothetical protein
MTSTVAGTTMTSTIAGTMMTATAIAGHNKHGLYLYLLVYATIALRKKRTTKTSSTTIHGSQGQREPASNRYRLKISIKS